MHIFKNNIIIIIILLFILYYIYKCSKNYERFESITSITPEQLNVITNLSPHLIAIKNLSDLANQLMNGQLTVPGGLLINGDITVRGKSNLGNDLVVNGKTTLSNDTTINTNLQVNGSSKINADLTIGGVTIINNRLSVAKNTTLMGDTNLGQNLQINGITTLNDKLNFSKKQRQYMQGGMYSVRANAAQMPLYNGWNFVWPDNTWTEWYRKRVQWNGSSSPKYFHYFGGTDLRQTDGANTNWMPRFLNIMPDYKAKLYFYISGARMGDATTIYTEGEYDLAPNNKNININNRLLYIIALALVEENLPSDYIDVDQLRDLPTVLQ